MKGGPQPFRRWSVASALLALAAASLPPSCGGGGGTSGVSPPAERYPAAVSQGVDPRRLESAYVALSASPHLGYGGQFIVNVPARNAIIAAATAWSGVANAGDNWYLVLRTIVETILPSLR